MQQSIYLQKSKCSDYLIPFSFCLDPNCLFKCSLSHSVLATINVKNQLDLNNFDIFNFHSARDTHAHTEGKENPPKEEGELTETVAKSRKSKVANCVIRSLHKYALFTSRFTVTESSDLSNRIEAGSMEETRNPIVSIRTDTEQFFKSKRPNVFFVFLLTPVWC